MTGILDEKGQRYESTTYGGRNNAGENFAVWTAQGAGVRKEDTAAYTPNSGLNDHFYWPDTLDANTLQSRLTYTVIDGLYKLTSTDTPCAPDRRIAKTYTYDAKGCQATKEDFRGNVTETVYGDDGLLRCQVEAKGQDAERVTTQRWDQGQHLLTRDVAGKEQKIQSRSGWSYNARGQVAARCEIDPVTASGYTCAATGTAPAGVDGGPISTVSPAIRRARGWICW